MSVGYGGILRCTEQEFATRQDEGIGLSIVGTALNIERVREFT
jgi:hypothetical protein